MTRSFTAEPIDEAVIERMVDLATRAPSAGKSQGWHLIVLSGDEARRFWDISFPPERREGFLFPGLFEAPVLAIPLADPDAYVNRYAEPDKAHTGLGASADAWPTPYWTVDASMSVMTLLLAAEDEGLGALFFGIFSNEDAIRSELRIPDAMQILGVIALGWPAPETRAGLSASRPRRRPADVIHRGGW
jgi:nitroreductase